MRDIKIDLKLNETDFMTKETFHWFIEYHRNLADNLTIYKDAILSLLESEYFEQKEMIKERKKLSHEEIVRKLLKLSE
jgi:hypothetical protein